MPRRSLSLESPLVRGAIAAVMLAAIAAAFLLLRDSDDGASAPTLSGAPSPGATAIPEAGIGPRDDNPPIVGQPAPDFTLRDLDGEAVTLSDLRGRVVLVNFWATWCRPCKKELPVIQKVADEYPADLVVLAVNWQEDAGDARAYFEDNGLRLRVLLDGGGVYDQYRLRGLPDSFFIARDGTLAAYQFGELSEKKLRERLAQAGLAPVP
jgi:thiol-disulfide isomerase/thioredoxin